MYLAGPVGGGVSRNKTQRGERECVGELLGSRCVVQT